jgi:hypothetical protein
MQIIVEDKENRRDMVNRQSANNPPSIPQAPVLTQTQQTSSTTSLLKRSKTSDPLRAPLRQKDAAGTTIQLDKRPPMASEKSNQLSAQSGADKTNNTSTVVVGEFQSETLPALQEAPQIVSSQTPPSPSDELAEQPSESQLRMEEVARVVEERRKERMKTLTRNLEVCDLLDIRNPQSAAEYAPQIYKHLHSEEQRHLYPADFLVGNQSEITEKMRAYLIDWLSELHLKFKLWPETLYVCVGLIDKFIMLQPDIKKKDLQCLGITALHVAGKYEEIYPPELKQILRVTDNAVSKEQVLQLEFDILQALDFNLTFPSILRFMERYARIA